MVVVNYVIRLVVQFDVVGLNVSTLFNLYVLKRIQKTIPVPPRRIDGSKYLGICQKMKQVHAAGGLAERLVHASSHAILFIEIESSI